MVRALVAGVGDFPEPHITEEEQAAGRAIFWPLPAVREAVEQVAHSLQQVGVAPGEPLQEPDRDALRNAWDSLRHGAPKGEPLIVHFAGHGTQPPAGGSLYLACSGGDPAPEGLDDTCVSFRELLETAENSGRPVLFLLDVCGAGRAITQQHLLDLLAGRAQDAHRNVWVIAACTADNITYGARFTTATAQVLERLADGALDVDPTLPHVPVATLADAIDGEMDHADRDAGRPHQDIVRTPHHQARLEPQPFLDNPDFSTDPGARLVTGLNAELQEFAHSCVPGLDPLHFATRAAGNPRADVVQFSGRTAELARIAAWIENTDGTQDRLLVVTGSPGSGKSALLGVTVCITHPDLDVLGARVRPVVRPFDPHPPGAVLAVHARQRTLEQITDSLHKQFDGQLPAVATATRDRGPEHDRDTDPDDQALLSTPEALVTRLAKAGEVVVILDALDEAADPSAVLDQLLFPLSGAAGGGAGYGCRVMIGTRPWWDTLPALGERLVRHPDRFLDLDPASPEDCATLARDLGAYLNLLLGRRYGSQKVERIAAQLARYSDSGAFLVATLYANHLLASAEGTTPDPPRSITEVFDLHLRTQTNPWMEPVLEVLGQARGQGMPLDLIHIAALAHAPQHAQQPMRPRPQDTRRALTEAQPYLRTTCDTNHRLLYRYFHQALTDHTAPRIDPATLYSALFDAIPRTRDDTPDWAHAHPYLLRHAADHATAVSSKALDQLLEDPSYLLYAEPDTVTPHLHNATTEQAILHARIYGTTTAHHPDRHQLTARRDLLTFDAACWRQPHLAHTFAAIPIADRPALAEPVWATNRTADPAVIHTLKGHTSSVGAVATLLLSDDTPVAVTAGDDGTAIVWNLTTGQRIHTLVGHTRRVNAVATLVLPADQTPVAVTASSDGTARVWNLATGQRVHTLEGHSDSVNAVATSILRDGTPVAVTAGSDCDAIVWNLSNGRPRRSLKGHSNSVNSVATLLEPNGIRVAVTISGDGDAIVWNLANGKRRRTFKGISKWGEDVATLVLPDDTSAAVSTRDNCTAFVWDLRTGKRITTLRGHSSSVRAVATLVQRNGNPVAVTAGDDHSAFVWTLSNGHGKRRRVLESHWRSVRAVATLLLRDGTPVAVTAGTDRTAFVWDLSVGKRRHGLKGHTSWVNAVATLALPDGASVAVTASSDRDAIVWNPATGKQRRTFKGHSSPVRAVATLMLPDDTPAAITAGDDRTAIVWNPVTGKRLRLLEDHSCWVEAVATLELPDGTPMVVTANDDGTAIVWNPANGERRRTFRGHERGALRAVATLMLPDDTPAAVTAGDDGTAIVWNPDTGERILSLEGHEKSVNAVAALVQPNRRPVVVTASSDCTAIVWDLDDGQRIHTLEGHTNSVRSVATFVLPDDTLAAITTSDDRTAIVWDLDDGQPVWRLTLPAEGRCVSATDKGFMIGCGREVAHFVWNAAK